MPLATTQRSGLVEQVIGQLRDAVTREEWPLGQQIPPEAELATSLGVGRNTVREAVRALAYCGLLEVRQGDGTYVRATSEVSGAVRRLCGSELREVLQVRKALEAEGARLAAIARSDAELRTLTTVLKARNSAQWERRFDEFVHADAEFHLAVVRCGDNAVLTELYRGMTEAITASVAATSRAHLESGQEIGHDALLEAIADRDPDRAAAEARGFLDQLLVNLPASATAASESPPPTR